tara:strand:+ start:302 stop:778 length:477 start_codon:yes stop_codon:yes gene_type:complete
MKLEVNVDTKYFYILLGAIFVLAGTFVVFAATAPNPGHVGSSVTVDLPNGPSDVSIQQALNDGDLGCKIYRGDINSDLAEVIANGATGFCWFKRSDTIYYAGALDSSATSTSTGTIPIRCADGGAVSNSNTYNYDDTNHPFEYLGCSPVIGSAGASFT